MSILKFYDKGTGFTQIPNVLIRNENIPLKYKMLFIVLCSRNPSYPSYDQLMIDLATRSRGMISKGIKWLSDYNLIHYDKGYKQGVSNRYFINHISKWDKSLLPNQFIKVPDIADQSQFETSNSVNTELAPVSNQYSNNNNEIIISNNKGLMEWNLQNL